MQATAGMVVVAIAEQACVVKAAWRGENAMERWVANGNTNVSLQSGTNQRCVTCVAEASWKTVISYLKTVVQSAQMSPVDRSLG